VLAAISHFLSLTIDSSPNEINVIPVYDLFPVLEAKLVLALLSIRFKNQIF